MCCSTTTPRSSAASIRTGATGRAEIEPTYQGYSIGRWIDSDGDGRFDTLEAETRAFKGPRALDPAGMPTHADNQSIVKERFFFDKTDPKLLHDEITLIDHAFTRPWTVLKTYRRSPAKFPIWTEQSCPEISVLIDIRRRDLFQRRRRYPPAHPQGPVASGPAIFPSIAEVAAPARGAGSVVQRNPCN